MKNREELFNIIVGILISDNKEKLEKMNLEKLCKEEKEELIAIAKRNKVLEIIQEILYNNNIKVFGDNNNEKLRTRELYKLRFAMVKNILEEFEKKNIMYTVLKGAYLGDMAYGEMGIRTSNDLDILIEKGSIKDIKKICYDNGFVAGKSDRINKKILHYNRTQEIAFSLNTHQIATVVKINTDPFFGFYDTVIDFNFGVSWGGDKNENLKSELFLKHRKKIQDSNNNNYYVLDVAHNFIQLCLHAYKEANGLFFVNLNQGLVLRAFLDIYYYINKNVSDDDMNKILHYIERYNVEKYIYYIVYIINEVFEKDDKCTAILNSIVDKCDISIIDKFGLDCNKNWGDVEIKERFYSEDTVAHIEDQINEKELERIKLASVEFY